MLCPILALVAPTQMLQLANIEQLRFFDIPVKTIRNQF